MNIRTTPTVGHQVDALGRIAGEDDLFALACIDEAGNFDARLLHCGRCFFAERVDPTMDIGMIGLVVGAHGINDSLGFLRTCRAVKVHQRFPMHLARQDRKVVANICYRTDLLVRTGECLICNHNVPCQYSVNRISSASLGLSRLTAYSSTPSTSQRSWAST